MIFGPKMSHLPIYPILGIEKIFLQKDPVIFLF